MTLPPHGLDFHALEQNLKVLAFENRLELLSLLRKPHTIDEIRIGRAFGEEQRERVITRQAVRNHLDRMMEAGIVRMRIAERRGEKGKRALQEYVVDHARLFAIVDEMRQLTLLESEVAPDPYATYALSAPGSSAWPEGPKLVIVRGVHEGRALPLRRADATGERGWIIGRSKRANIPLEYDPYISSENSEIIRTPAGYRLLDLRNARNGTLLNWQRVPVGGEVPLQNGDVIGVGRTLLLFREE